MVLQHPASTSLVRAGVLISLLLATLPPPTSGLSCEKLEADLLPSVEDSVTSAYQNATVRRVDLTEGHDTSACLNPGNQPDPPPCVTLPYALYGTAVPEVLAAILCSFCIHRTGCIFEVVLIQTMSVHIESRASGEDHHLHWAWYLHTYQQ